MTCDEVKIDLALFGDGELAAEKLEIAEAHLRRCPNCRAAIADYNAVKADLTSLRRAAIPASVLSQIRGRVASRLPGSFLSSSIRLPLPLQAQIRKWLLPGLAGGFASITLAFLLLSAIISGAARIATVGWPDLAANDKPMYLPGASGPSSDPADYARQRYAVSGRSPSVNPSGALVALTRSLVRGGMKDDEITVVADVFGSGLARIAEVVEPTPDSRQIDELRKALGSDPSAAPFMPAALDQRPESVRVVLRIQNVNVDTNSNVRRQRPRSATAFPKRNPLS